MVCAALISTIWTLCLCWFCLAKLCCSHHRHTVSYCNATSKNLLDCAWNRLTELQTLRPLLELQSCACVAAKLLSETSYKDEQCIMTWTAANPFARTGFEDEKCIITWTAAYQRAQTGCKDEKILNWYNHHHQQIDVPKEWIDSNSRQAFTYNKSMCQNRLQGWTDHELQHTSLQQIGVARRAASDTLPSAATIMTTANLCAITSCKGESCIMYFVRGRIQRIKGWSSHSNFLKID